MASAPAQRGHNLPEVRPIIVKKIVAAPHGGHHGGAWKVAYADFVTAMMAFFMLMWLLSITDQQKRRGLAEYFSPTIVQKERSPGSSGILDGSTVQAVDDTGPTSPGGAMQTTSSRREEDQLRAKDRARFEQLKKALMQRVERTPELRRLKDHLRFSAAPEGLRIDIVDKADFSMFKIGTDRLLPPAQQLIREVAVVIAHVPNGIIVRGHTDALPYAAGQTMNNWMLSTARAEATRATLGSNGIVPDRFARIEGVADREPFTRADLYDARNRRMSITLMWSEDAPREAALTPKPATTDGAD